MDTQAKVRTLMQAEYLDALVIANPENFFYLSGVRLLMQRLVPNQFSFVILAEERTVLVTVHSDADHARRDSRVKNIIEYGHTDTPVEALAMVISELGLARGRIGIETDFLPAAEFSALTHRLNDSTWVSAGTILRDARMRKSPDEISVLRTGQHRTELAITAAVAMSQEGDSEQEMAQRIGANFFTYGAEAVDFILLTIGKNSTVFHLLPGPDRARRGDIVHLDCGASFGNYRSDLSRNFAIGDATRGQRDTYARLWDVQRAVIGAIRPGVLVRTLVAHYVTAMRDVGLEPPGDHLGHGIGLSSHEYPELTGDCDVELMPGMVLAIEPNTFVQGDARYDIEDVVVVTEQGSEMLSGKYHQRDIWVV
jgi:Xaa-Pro dipeptidase